LIILIIIGKERIQVIKLLIMHFSPVSCQVIPLRSKYSPQHPVLTHPQSVFFPNMRDQVSHQYKIGKIIALYILLFMPLDSRQEDKRFSEVKGSKHSSTVICS
jgi:hypothetical protein